MEAMNLSFSIEDRHFKMINLTNITEEDMDFEQVGLILEHFRTDKTVLTLRTCITFIILYTLVVIFAVCGNSIVMIAVVKRKEMRTARNIFIFNLALSDLLMAVTIPMTLMDGLLRSWNLPDSYVACRWVLENKF